LNFTGAGEKSAAAEQVKTEFALYLQTGFAEKNVLAVDTVYAPGAATANDGTTNVISGIAVCEFHQVSGTKRGRPPSEAGW
jgi:hypothetical protein